MLRNANYEANYAIELVVNLWYFKFLTPDAEDVGVKMSCDPDQSNCRAGTTAYRQG